METQSKPLQRWMDAQHQLDHAIHHFLESTAALYDSRNSYSNDPDLLEKVTSAAHRGLTSMTGRINKLQNARLALKKIRNDSTSLIPMNRIPLEILVQIFHLCIRKNDPFDTLMMGLVYDYCPQELLTLVQVCTHWGRIILTTPSLWSDFYLNVGVFKEIYKSRSPNLFSLHLDYARNRFSSLTYYIGYVPHTKALQKATCEFLGPHIKNLGILRFAGVSNVRTLEGLLELWRTNARGSVHSLTILPKDRSTVALPDERLDMTRWSVEDQNSFLLPIRVLRLVGSYFRWDSPVFHNLVVLQLGYMGLPASPSLQQMQAVLRASPCLEFVHLFNIPILFMDDPTPPQPVVLSALKVLDVGSLDRVSLEFLLPMIVPQSQELSVRMSIYPDTSDDRLEAAVLPFLARSNITRLFLDTRQFSTEDLPLAKYLSATPNLRTLILELGSKPGDVLLPAIVRSSPTTAPTSRCPKLHALYLMNGSIQNETVRNIVEAHPHLGKIVFRPCFLEPSDEEVLHWLRPRVNDAMHTTTGFSDEVILNWFATLA